MSILDWIKVALMAIELGLLCVLLYYVIGYYRLKKGKRK